MRLPRRYSSCLLLLLLLLQLLPAGPNTCVADNLTDTVPLTAEERRWLQAHPVITLAPDADFKPIEYIDKNGIYQGAAADIIRLLEKKLSITITIAHLKNWDEVMAKFKNHEVDMLGAMVRTPKREEFALFTETIVSVPGGIFTNSENNNSLTLNGLSGKKVAVVSNYTAHDILKNQYPDILLDVVPDVSTGLAKASLGMVDAYIENMANATYYARDAAISNLRLAGMTDFTYHWGIGIRKDWPELQGILNKGLAAISEGEREQIIRRYVSIDYQGWRPTRTMILSSAASLLAVLLLLVVYWNYSLRKAATERKKVEKVLSESEKRYRSIVENSNDAILIHDFTGTILDLNENACLMFGYSRNELQGAKLGKIDSESNTKHMPERMAQLMANNVILFEGEHTRKDGSVLPTEVSAKVVSHEHNGIIQSFIRDVTELKQVLEEKVKLQQQLLQSQKMESVGRLAGGVAHDFNNMLGVILGYTELAMERIEPDNPLHANLKKIQGAAQRSADLTRQLLAFARKQTVSPKVINLNDTIESALNLLRRLIGEDIDLTWPPGKEVWPVKIDPTQVDQMLTNLCVNARDAIVDTGKVTIETGIASFDEEYCAHHAGFVPGDYVLLAVSDTGCGMDEETQAHLFEPFFTTKEMGKGTGLGLATVYGVVKQNNGFINVYSEPGQGTTFKIYLPRHLDKTVPLPEKGPDKPGERGHETVLLVEDEPAILEMTTGMLEKLGYTVLAAGTPGEAIRLAQEHPGRIDLLLTDLVMPEMNGRDLTKKLLSIYPDIRRLFMSGYTANVIAHHGVLDEGVHFLQKPFSMKDLGEKLREALKG